MCGGRKQRQSDYLIGFLFLLLLVASCASKAGTSDDERYQQSTLLFRRGNLQQALTEAEKGIAASQDHANSTSYWKYRILKAEVLISQGRSKDALVLLESPLPEGVDSDNLALRLRIVKVKGMLRLGRTEEARALLDEAETLARSKASPSALAEIQIQRGNLLTIQNRPDEGETAFQTGLKLAEAQKDVYFQTVALNNLGISRIRQFRYDEAIPFLTRAEAGFREIGANLFAAIALGNLGLCANRLGDFDRAFSNYAKAIEVQEREGAKPYLEGSLGEVGNIYTFQNDFQNAIPYYQRALALALEINAISDASKWAGNLATSFASVRNWDQAEKFNEQARELKERLKDTDSQKHTRLNAGSIAAGRRQTGKAIALFNEVIATASKEPTILWDAHARLGSLYRDVGDMRNANEHFEAAIRTIETSRSELTLPDYKITFLSSLMGFYQDYIDMLIDQGAFDKALQVAESSRSRILAERLGRGRGPQPVPFVQDYAKAARQSKAVFLEYWLAPRRSFLWVVTGEKRNLFVLPPRDEIESLVKSYASMVQDLRDPLDPVPAAASRLYEILLSPARGLVPPGSRVVLVPDGALHNLNFETLPVADKTTRFWIDDVTVSIAPFLIARARELTPSPSKSMLVIGNPLVSGNDSQPLPNAGSEIRNVAERMNSMEKVVYQGAQAEPAVYRASEPGRFSMIHFAAHAVANRESPLESAIILSPANQVFKLYARDVMQLPLHADLVTISACRGAGARVYSGEGLVGFTWAFLQAGARNVIAGLWDVTDSSTAQLMDGLYAGLAAGKSPADALRNAKLGLIHSPGNFRKPYYWAPFQLYVGGL